MSTRATIAVHRSSCDYFATYLHFDGYPDHAGQILETSYGTAEEIESLVGRGDIRSLDAETGEAEYYDGDVPAASLPTLDALLDYARNCGAQYLYLYDNDEWTQQKL